MGWTNRVQFLAGVGNFSPCHHIQNSSEAHLAPYPMGSGGFFPEGIVVRA